MENTFELYYSCGGHGGPYPDIKEAIESAQRLAKGFRHPTTIEIRSRNSPRVGGFGDNHKESIYVSSEEQMQESYDRAFENHVGPLSLLDKVHLFP